MKHFFGIALVMILLNSYNSQTLKINLVKQPFDYDMLEDAEFNQQYSRIEITAEDNMSWDSNVFSKFFDTQDNLKELSIRSTSVSSEFDFEDFIKTEVMNSKIVKTIARLDFVNTRITEKFIKFL